MPLTTEGKDMLVDCERLSKHLNDWEFDFVESLGFRHSLSPAQASKLYSIWNRITEEAL